MLNTGHVLQVVRSYNIKIYDLNCIKFKYLFLLNSVFIPIQQLNDWEELFCRIDWTFALQKMKRSSCLLPSFLFCLLTQNLIGKYLLVKLQEELGQDEGKLLL